MSRVRIKDGHREVHRVIAEHGPVTAQDVANILESPRCSVAGRIQALRGAGHLDVYELGALVQKYVVGPRPLPPRELAVAPADGPMDTTTRPLRERIHARCVSLGLEVQVDLQRDYRVSAPHPFGDGRVWLDTHGDVDAWLLDLRQGPAMDEEWRNAA